MGLFNIFGKSKTSFVKQLFKEHKSILEAIQDFKKLQSTNNPQKIKAQIKLIHLLVEEHAIEEEIVLKYLEETHRQDLHEEFTYLRNQMTKVLDNFFEKYENHVIGVSKEEFLKEINIIEKKMRFKMRKEETEYYVLYKNGD